MGAYNFELVKTTLTDAEKDRMLAIYFNSSDATIDWEKATSDYGAASVDSMKVSLRNSMKKLEKAAAAGGDLPPPPQKSSKGKKRKAASEEDGETKPAKRGRKPKKAAVEEEKAAEESEE